VAKQVARTIWKNSLLPFGMLAFFLLGFYALERFNPFGMIDGKTVMLSNIPSSGDNGADGFQVEQVIKRNVAYPVYNLLPIDRDRFVFTDKQNQFSLMYKRLAENNESAIPEWSWTEHARIGVMNINGDHTDFLDSNMVPGSAAISPDRSLMVYSGFGSGPGKEETLLRSLASGETLRRFDEASFTNLFVDHDTIMGLLPTRLTGWDLADPSTTSSLGPRDKWWWHSLKTTGVPEQFCFIAQKAGVSQINRINLRQPGGTETGIIMEGDDIDDYIPLNGRKLLYRGSRNGTRGIYVFDGAGNQHVLLREGAIPSFDVASGGNKLAYALQNSSGAWELHAAWLREGKLDGDRLIYGGLRNLDSVKWGPDGDSLFCVSMTMEGSALYRFILK
jgi:hypothetical protein